MAPGQWTVGNHTRIDTSNHRPAPRCPDRRAGDPLACELAARIAAATKRSCPQRKNNPHPTSASKSARKGCSCRAKSLRRRVDRPIRGLPWRRMHSCCCGIFATLDHLGERSAGCNRRIELDRANSRAVRQFPKPAVLQECPDFVRRRRAGRRWLRESLEAARGFQPMLGGRIWAGCEAFLVRFVSGGGWKFLKWCWRIGRLQSSRFRAHRGLHS